jgi:hypothetical protein
MSSQMWRAVAVYRVVTLCYAAVVIIGNDSSYAHPAGGYLALLAMTAWTGVTIIAYARPRYRQPWLVVLDVGVATTLIISTRWIDTAAPIAHGAPTIPVIWAASPILAAAVRGRPWAGMAAALPVWIGDLVERQARPSQSTVAGLVLLLVAGGVGYLVRLSQQAEAATDSAARRSPAASRSHRAPCRTTRRTP